MASTDARVRQALAHFRKRGLAKNRAGMARYGIVTAKVFGVPMGDVQRLGRQIGRDHALALALWKSGWYEARMLAAYVADPARVTPALMDRWAKDFDNWATCDTLCFVLFDRSPHAWGKIRAWSRRREEFVKRAAFALLAGVALHDKAAPDEPFLRSLPAIERAARDDRNYVKKGVSWALRSIGHRNRALHAAALACAGRLAAASDPPSRWIGHDALRDLRRPLVAARVAAREARKRPATSSR